MNSTDKFWLGIWGLATIVTVIVVISITVACHNKNTVILEMVKTGMSPIAALCALDDTIGNNPTCVILAIKEKE